MYKSPFKWWVQSVMPLVFDDSLSYYEVLAKLTKYIEGLTGDVEQIEKILATIEGIEDITQFTEFLERIQAEIGDLANLSTQSKTNLVSAINEIALKADIAYYKPPTGIPESDLSQTVQDKLNKTGEATKYIINNKELKAAPSNNSPADLGLGTYSVPAGGIPWDTLSQDVQNRINAGGSGTGGTKDYTELINKPQIDGHTLNAGNNTSESLGLGNYRKPITGIPESDLSAEVQEKLNTSGGIADNETSFVATRDYEAGELIYINGVLYKTKYRILSGTNLIPGNNIETTDISNEIEKINSDIEALQSGSGPDSWTLGTNIQNVKSGSTVRFFEYFNCIGNESYLFIINPVHPFNNGAYYVYIKKRDGTQVDRQRFDAGGNEAQHRFTFVPTDTGEYYCEFESLSDSSICDYRIEIEYTQSQGISELWSQVNKASQLEPRVSALEVLTGEQQEQLENLNGIPARVETLENDVDDLKSTFDSNKNKHFNLVWERGSLTTTGTDTTYHANSRIRTVGILQVINPIKINAINDEDTSAFSISYYDKNGNHIKNSSAWLKNEILRPGENVRILMTLTPSSNTAVDIGTILNAFTISDYLIEPTNLYTSAYENKLLSLKRNYDAGPGGNRNTSNNSFAIAHISDLHTDATRLDYFVKFCDYFKQYIDAKICTGDYVNSPVTEEIEHMKDHGTDNILFCVGNHERGGYNSTHMSLADVYTAWDVSTIQTNNNAVSDNDSLYYYVDYVKTGAGGYKIRLIVLNNISQTNNSKVNTYTPAEIEWLINVLKDSATDGYSVLLASHYEESAILDNDKGFYCTDNTNSNEYAFTPVVENIIDAFRNSSRYQLNNAFVRDNSDEYLLTFDADFTSYPKGNFLAWMVGHFHTDRIGYSASNPNILYLSVCAGVLESEYYPTGTDMSRFNDIPRVKGTETEDAFNVYSFDIKNNLCKVLRIGSNLNYKMIPRDIACFGTSPVIPYAITKQPVDVLAEAGKRVNYSITAPGTTSYFWEYSTDGGNTWKPSNNTTAGISFAMSAAYSGRMYRCTVSNGKTSITSRAALLTVAEP